MINLILFAQDVGRRSNCPEGSNGKSCVSNLPEVSANSDQVKNGLAAVFAAFAAVAVLVIVIAAINFATADGNPEDISKAKKTIIYALVGLVIALSAEAAVLTVIGRL